MKDRIPVHLTNTPATRYFYEVANAGSFRKAADRVNIAASAINRHVRLLEDALGTKLFERGRGRGGVKLTPAGEVLMRRVGYALNELATAATEINELRGGLRRVRITAGVPDAIAQDVLTTFLPAFDSTDQNIHFDIKVASTPQLVDMLLDDKIELILAYDVPPQMGIMLRAEYALGSSIVVHPGHPLAGRDAVRLAECAPFPLALSDETRYLRALLDRMLTETGVMPSPLLTTNSYQLMRDLVRQGLAVSVQTRVELGASSVADDLVYVPLRDPLARYSILTCATRSGRRLSGTVERFAQALVDYLDKHIGEVRCTPSASAVKS